MSSESGHNEEWEMTPSTAPKLTTSFNEIQSQLLGEKYLLEKMESNHVNYTPPLGNGTLPDLPIDMQFNEGHRLAIIIYSMLMIVSTIGNLSVLVTIVK